MAQDPPLSQAEERLIGHLRRLCRQARDFKIEVYGSFKQGRRIIELRPCAYERYETEELASVFEAID